VSTNWAHTVPHSTLSMESIHQGDLGLSPGLRTQDSGEITLKVGTHRTTGDCTVQCSTVHYRIHRRPSWSRGSLSWRTIPTASGASPTKRGSKMRCGWPSMGQRCRTVKASSRRPSGRARGVVTSSAAARTSSRIACPRQWTL
jgi:hypothetical protein